VQFLLERRGKFRSQFRVAESILELYGGKRDVKTIAEILRDFAEKRIVTHARG